MKLAFTTLACPEWRMEQVAEAAGRYGYEGVELRLVDGAIIEPSIDAATRRRVRDICAAANLPIICVDTSVRIAQPDPAERAKQVRDGMALLELAAEWNAPLIRVFAGPPDGTSEADAVSAAVACLEPLAERGRELGVAVALETHDAFASSAATAATLQQVPGAGTGALWDLLHPFRVGDAIETTFERLHERLLHVHIKDGRRPADGGPNWDLTLLGEGDVPTLDMLRLMQRAGYQGWLAVEWEKKWHPELAAPEIALPQHADVLRGYLAAL